jgi:chemotaxis protein CheC
MVEMELGPAQLDAVREISSIAAGNASISLSRMLGKKVTVGLPEIALESIEGASEALGDREAVVSAVYSSVAGEISGSMLVALSPSETARLARTLTGEKAQGPGELGEMEMSAVKELANILVGSYLRVFSRELGMALTHSVPSFASDMGGAILDGLLARQSLEAEYVVVMEGTLTVEGPPCGMRVLFILEPGGLRVMLEALGFSKEQER